MLRSLGAQYSAPANPRNTPAPTMSPPWGTQCMIPLQPPASAPTAPAERRPRPPARARSSSPHGRFPSGTRARRGRTARRSHSASRPGGDKPQLSPRPPATCRGVPANRARRRASPARRRYPTPSQTRSTCRRRQPRPHGGARRIRPSCHRQRCGPMGPTRPWSTPRASALGTRTRNGGSDRHPADRGGVRRARRACSSRAGPRGHPALSDVARVLRRASAHMPTPTARPSCRAAGGRCRNSGSGPRRRNERRACTPPGCPLRESSHHG
mmetsp:Transcript_101369/g.293161  ORF Transcript_101369/g.293161 Transcript_101369/m.293161 type:complete len:269 (+) Transcript_101369:301-1107(+)